MLEVEVASLEVLPVEVERLENVLAYGGGGGNDIVVLLDGGGDGRGRHGIILWKGVQPPSILRKIPMYSPYCAPWNQLQSGDKGA